MYESAPAALGEQGLNHDHQQSDFTLNHNNYHPRLALAQNRLKVRQQMADRLFRQGQYSTPSRAMQALIGR